MLKWEFWSNIPKDHIIVSMGKYHKKVQKKAKKTMEKKELDKSSVSTGTHSVTTRI